MATSLGVERARIIEQMPHSRLHGFVNGREVKIVVSLSKALVRLDSTKANIRRAVEGARQ